MVSVGLFLAAGCVPDSPTASIYDTAYAGGPILATPDADTTIVLAEGTAADSATVRFAWDTEWNLRVGYFFQLSTDSTFQNTRQMVIDRRGGFREIVLTHARFQRDRQYFWRVSRYNWDQDKGGENRIREIWNGRTFRTE